MVWITAHFPREQITSAGLKKQLQSVRWKPCKCGASTAPCQPGPTGRNACRKKVRALPTHLSRCTSWAPMSSGSSGQRPWPLPWKGPQCWPSRGWRPGSGLRPSVHLPSAWTLWGAGGERPPFPDHSHSLLSFLLGGVLGMSALCKHGFLELISQQ